MAEEATETKPGWKTSEFWKSLMVSAVGGFLVVYGAVTGRESLVMTGMGAMAVSSAAYGVSRAMTKGGEG